MTQLFEPTEFVAPAAPSADPPFTLAPSTQWREVLRVFVQGDPKAQPRPRAFARKFGDKFSARVYDAGTAEGWKGCIALAVRGRLPAQPLEGPVRIDADFLFARPKRLMRKCDPQGEIEHESKPDRDNLEKSLLDCLKTLGLFAADNAQVCAGEVRKFYVGKGGWHKPGMRLVVGVKGGD